VKYNEMMLPGKVKETERKASAGKAIVKISEKEGIYYC